MTEIRSEVKQMAEDGVKMFAILNKSDPDNPKIQHVKSFATKSMWECCIAHGVDSFGTLQKAGFEVIEVMVTPIQK